MAVRTIKIPLTLLLTLWLCQTPALAQATSQMDFKHDSSQPIEITADTLDVAQTDQTAVFSGSVIAVQGDLRLGSDTLRVYYRDGKERTGDQGAISRLDALGSVAITSPRETANSEWAVYDVDSGQITLGGKVVLTRGENVLRGEQLVIDLASGQSRIVGKQGGGGGRVKGLFIPAKKQPQ